MFLILEREIGPDALLPVGAGRDCHGQEPVAQHADHLLAADWDEVPINGQELAVLAARERVLHVAHCNERHEADYAAEERTEGHEALVATRPALTQGRGPRRVPRRIRADVGRVARRGREGVRARWVHEHPAHV